MKKALILLILLLSFKLLLARQLFVSLNGDDQNMGTIDKPYKTLQFALNSTLAGDTLYIRGEGYFTGESVKVVNSGKKEKWITISGFPGEEVTINADDFLRKKPAGRAWRWHMSGSLQLDSVKYIKISGITVVESHSIGILVHKSSNIIVENCRTLRSYNSGIGLWYSDSLLVRNCEVMIANTQDKRPEGQDVHREAPHEAISVAGCKYFEIAYNHVHQCIKEGIDCKEFSAHGKIHHNYCHDIHREGIYIDSWFGLLEDVEIYSNIVHDCEWGIMVSSEGKASEMRNVRIYNNLVYDNWYNGIQFSPLGYNCLRHDIYIYNNTIVNNGMPGHWGGKAGGIDIRTENLKDIYIFNNLVYNNYSFEMATFASPDNQQVLKEKNIVFKNNLSGSFHDLPAPEGFFNIQVYALTGENNFQAKLEFISIQAGNFELIPDLKKAFPSIQINGFGYGNYCGANVSEFFHIKKIAGRIK